MSCDPLPVIDLRQAAGPGRAQLASRLVAALETDGFFYVEGIDGYDEHELMSYTRWFFNLPDDVKMGIARKKFNEKTNFLYRGYFPVDKTDSSHKEGYDLASLEPLSDPEKVKGNIFYEPTPWPETSDTEGLRKFQEFSVRFYGLMTAAGMTLLELAAEGCGAPSDKLVNLFRPDPVSTLRYLHYPPRQGDIPASARDPTDDAVLLCAAHHDSGFVTMVSTFDYEGLELQRADGSWMPVPCRSGAVVVNIGDMLSTISGGKWKATNHRVIDHGVNRFSVPFFLEPRYTANMSVRLPCSGQAEPAEVSYGPWAITKMINNFYEFKDIPYPKSLVAE
ncbi:2-oxoglutarate-dependent dioxygenase citB-like [Amphibalanus amphitrite]|uniref:2-oxoglutarate-dependent dioxygenase citB-like n=1 Tax=Amphibalanus amphitrite TaxID=1232801 RepID=UPI001C919DC4|nr:2-oxoglutarate-dependent dioxygenase citB-like [Amphibalanus amphitrite]